MRSHRSSGDKGTRRLLGVLKRKKRDATAEESRRKSVLITEPLAYSERKRGTKGRSIFFL